jgi:HK97 family phage major capsid protein
VTTTELTLREQVEAGHKAISDKAAQVEALGSRATADDWAALNQMTEALADTLNAYNQAEEARGVQGKARALLDELAGVPKASIEVGAISGATGIVNPRGMTVGEAFVNSPLYAEMLARNVTNDGMGGFGGRSGVLNFGATLATARRDLRYDVGPDGQPRNALITGASDTSGGAFTSPQHTGIVADSAMFRELGIWDICTKLPITSDVFDYVEITSKTNNAAFVPEAISSAPIVAGVPTAVDAGVKPESTMALAVRTVPVENIAHLTYVTRRAAADAPRLMTIVDTFLREGLAVKVEDQILLGNGTSPNLRGLINTTIPYAISTFDMSVNAVTSRVIAVLRAIATVRSFGHRPTAMVVNSSDWYNSSFLALTDSAGNFILGDPRASVEQLNQMWGLRVIVNDGVPAGTQVVGDFSHALIGDREQASIYMTDSNRDLFERNILTLLAEQRLGFGVDAPKAFCTVVA